MKASLVSVLMPAYSAEPFIGEAIESVLAQTYDNWELVIVNDGSQDKTSAVANSFVDLRIRVIDLPTNLGLAGVRNRAVVEAQGDFIAFLDADDRMTSSRLQLQLKIFDKSDRVGLCGGQFASFQTGAEPDHISSLPLSNSAIQSAMLFYDPLATSTVMVRSSIMKSIGFRSAFPPMEDYDAWQRITQSYEVQNIPDVLAEYRVHPTQSSRVMTHNIADKLKRIRADRLLRLLPDADSHDINLHHHLCEGTYWAEFDSIDRICQYSIRLSRSVGKHCPSILDDLRTLLRSKLLALTYAHDCKMTPEQRRSLCRTLMRRELWTGLRDWYGNLRGYVHAFRTSRSVKANIG